VSAGGPRPAGRRLQARAVHRVTPDDVGQRVSIRHGVAPDAGTDASVTDVVGRLLGYADGVLALVDREGQLALVAEDAIVASRTVPPHPRLPAEPEDLGTAQRPLERDAARVLLLDDRDRALLVAHRAAPDRTVWTAPGGGVRPGEDHLAAATRELAEELGLDAQVGPWVWSRRVGFVYAGVHLLQAERWFLTRVPSYDEVAAPLDDPGLVGARWWTLDQLRTTSEIVAPGAIAEHLAALLRDGPPDPPVDVGR
jgi:8-oxo-dGTP pyrophosphatase MutT (NUDIX family)